MVVDFYVTGFLQIINNVLNCILCGIKFNRILVTYQPTLIQMFIKPPLVYNIFVCLSLGFVVDSLALFQGDINKKEKSNQRLEQQIKNMANSCDEVNLKHTEELNHLEEEIQMIIVNIQVTPQPVIVFVNFQVMTLK